MRFKEDFLNELVRRLKENMDIIESSFQLSGVELFKNKMLDLKEIEHKALILEEDNPYNFLGKLIYTIINKQVVKVSGDDIACNLLLELVNLILDEFGIERVERV